MRRRRGNTLKAVDDITALTRADLDQQESMEFKGVLSPASAKARLHMSVLKWSCLENWTQLITGSSWEHFGKLPPEQKGPAEIRN